MYKSSHPRSHTFSFAKFEEEKSCKKTFRVSPDEFHFHFRKKTFRVAPDEWEGGSANMFQSGQRQQTSQTQKYLGSENKNFAVKDFPDKNFVQNLCCFLYVEAKS